MCDHRNAGTAEDAADTGSRGSRLRGSQASHVTSRYEQLLTPELELVTVFAFSEQLNSVLLAPRTSLSLLRFGH
jgi:hypothetical protein